MSQKDQTQRNARSKIADRIMREYLVLLQHQKAAMMAELVHIDKTLTDYLMIDGGDSDYLAILEMRRRNLKADLRDLIKEIINLKGGSCE